jgi:hypothetical protein
MIYPTYAKKTTFPFDLAISVDMSYQISADVNH